MRNIPKPSFQIRAFLLTGARGVASWWSSIDYTSCSHEIGVIKRQHGKLCTNYSKFDSIVRLMDFQLNPKCRYSRGVRGGGWPEGRSTTWPGTAGSGAVWAGEGASLPHFRADTQPVFFIAPLIRSEAVAEALCKVAVDRCEMPYNTTLNYV